MSALFASFVALIPLIYLNLIGLPDFIKRPLAQSVHRQGIDLEFETMRLFPSGIVVEKVILEAIKERGIPRLMFDEVLLDIDFSKILSRTLEVESLQLRKGRFAWPLQTTNQAPKSLAIDGIGLNLKFEAPDKWSLDHFQARALGGRLRLSGALTNATHLRRLGGRPAGRTPRSPEDLVAGLHRIVQVSEQLKFREPPEIGIRFDGDARDLENLKVRINLRAEGLSSPWISADRVDLSAIANESPRLNDWMSWQVAGRAEGLRATGFSAKDADVDMRGSLCVTNTQSLEAQWTVQSSLTTWNGYSSDQLAVRGRHALKEGGLPSQKALMRSEIQISATRPRKLTSNPEEGGESLHITAALDHSGLTELRGWELSAGATNLSTRWGRSGKLDVSFSGSPPLQLGMEDLWSAERREILLQGMAIQGKIVGTRVAVSAWGGIEVPTLASQVEWRHPILLVRDLSASGFGGAFQLAGDIDLGNRSCRAEVTSTLDPLALWEKLDPASVEWSRHVRWERPPEFKASARFSLPSSRRNGSSEPGIRQDWKDGLLSTASLNLGKVEVRGVRLEGITARAGWSNSMWSAPLFELRHSNGWIRLAIAQDGSSNLFRASLDSEMDPGVFIPWVGERAARTLNSIEFEAPPKLRVEASGDWRNLAGTRATGSLVTGPIAYQSNRFDSLSTRLGYADAILRFGDVKLARGEERVTAESIVYDLPNQWLSFTNGNSSMAVVRVTTLIGPKTTEAVNPYRFEKPPRVKVWGGLNVRDSEFTDMHFEVDADRFSYWRFNVPSIAARVDWVTNTLAVSNVRSSFYQGRMKGDFYFDFRRVDKGELRFDTEFENSDLKTLLADLTSPTNRADGVLDGKIVITSGLASDLRSWAGRGELNLEQGYLWNVPLFSVLSPVLNALSPGLGSSRGGKGRATFTVRNGQAHTEDLQMQEPVMRLRYRGWVDLDGELNAKVEAEPLGRSWFPSRALGFVLTPITKLFEYKVSGTLGQPKLEPLYFIPRLLLFPLNPFKNFKEFFPTAPKQDPPPAPKPAE